ncbi:hypothetical protein LRHMDP2_1905 [Lacticaseibacillus rhamnosus LRHMDP2]|uniref:Mobile element protein n=1 Tax=Lacticaseibacillus rhamnosus LRHMDP3 TaxID=1203259 RepID=A0AB33XWM6_LACRH|nr:hypothetical protein LRHMDP2_1905 [Lacticaseibacillus rhamnosus LRHMDP2]EKS52269.1 hypothetical protein LRHMDP3_640 [Lacticaseibacillus rhamnosus LRHMDP3]
MAKSSNINRQNDVNRSKPNVYLLDNTACRFAGIIKGKMFIVA